MLARPPYAPDLFQLLEKKGEAAYDKIEEILWSRSRVDFIGEYVRALRSFADGNEQSTTTPDAVAHADLAAVPQEKDIPPDLLHTIKLIASEGLVPKSNEIKPQKVAALLRHPEALLYAHLRIAASDSPYWEKYQPVPPERRPWERILANPLLATASLLIIFVCLAGAGGGAYYLGRAPLIDQVNVLLEQLGLRKPIETEGFVLSARDTLVLDARIDRRSIRRVLFRPLPGEERVLYQADQPQEGFEDVRAKHKYELHGPWAGKRVTAEVQFVPFDLPEDLLPPAESLVRRREILITTTLGLVLDPASTDAVRLDVSDPLTLSDEKVCHLQGVALADGAVYVLVRPVGVGTPGWHVQNYGFATEVRAGQLFMITSFFVEAEQFDVMAVLVPSVKDWPFQPGQTYINSIPSSEHRFGKVRVTVARPK